MPSGQFVIETVRLMRQAVSAGDLKRAEKLAAALEGDIGKNQAAKCLAAIVREREL